ncbi:MAG: hypothetical protein AAF629_23310 [Chloroflexota bacterium]
MNAPKRLKIKLAIESQDTLDLANIIPVFQSWIQHKTVPGLLIDVADYKHVPQGPGIMLIGHEADYGVTVEKGQASFIYDMKRELPTNLNDAIQLVTHRVVLAAQALSEKTGLTVIPGQATLILLDRLHYPNESTSYSAIEANVQATLNDVYQGEVTISHAEADTRRPLTITILANATINTILENRELTPA